MIELKNLEGMVRDLEAKREATRNLATTMTNLSDAFGPRGIQTSSIRGPDGGWVKRPLSSLSGGQWRRCSLAVTLGFADLVCSK